MDANTHGFAVADLVRFGNALAHAVGHRQSCPKVSPHVPCTCGAGGEQAVALNDWYELVRKLENGD